jgi:uncharacterized protein (DUF433 family)
MISASRYIVSDLEVLSGTPVFAGSRVPFAYLMEYLERESTVEKFSEDYASVSIDLATKALEEASFPVSMSVEEKSSVNRVILHS